MKKNYECIQSNTCLILAMPADNQKAIGHQLAINNVFGKKTKYL